jgi:hypothetical protein
MPSAVPLPFVGSSWSADVTRWALADGAVPAPTLPTGLAPQAAVAALARHRVLGLVAPHVDALDLPDPQRASLRQRHRREVATSLRVVATSREVTDILAEAGVRSLVVKGAALALTQQRDPTARGSGDVDVWVPLAEVRTAISALEVAGWHLRPKDTPTLLPAPHWRNRLYGWLTPEVVVSRAQRADVDLHWRLLRSPAALPIDFDEAWDRSVAVPELGPTARTTSVVDTLRHVAAHANKDGWPTLRHVVDLVATARVIDPDTRVRVARSDRTVRLGLAIGAGLDASVVAGVALDDRTRRLARQAWAECLAGRLDLRQRRLARGTEGIRLNAAMLAWQVRSAPGPAAALHPVVETFLPSRALFDEDPTPVALVRDVRRRLAASPAADADRVAGAPSPSP